MTNIKTQGFKSYRHESNPKEKELHDKFIKHCQGNDMDFIVFGHSKSPNENYPYDYLTDKEKLIVISTIPWLGSPIGQSFLDDCGFELKKKK